MSDFVQMLILQYNLCFMIAGCGYFDNLHCGAFVPLYAVFAVFGSVDVQASKDLSRTT